MNNNQTGNDPFSTPPRATVRQNQPPAQYNRNTAARTLTFDDEGDATPEVSEVEQIDQLVAPQDQQAPTVDGYTTPESLRSYGRVTEYIPPEESYHSPEANIGQQANHSAISPYRTEALFTSAQAANIIDFLNQWHANEQIQPNLLFDLGDGDIHHGDGTL